MAKHSSDNDETRTYVSLAKGTMVSHYRIVAKIGAGGMGEVYLVEDTKLNRKVALKFLPSHLCQEEDCRARFKREAQAAAKLSHPNIIHVYEVSEYQGRPFFAMEHVEGRSLKEFSSDKDPSIEQILELGIQICEGLNDAHEKGVTHRDIKPSNILIDSHGRVKIVDFGLASVVGTEHLTKTGSTLGTIGYMSPEQIQVKEVDQRSDLFSFGVVLYEMIAGRLPFKRDTEAATMNSVLNDVPEPLSRYKSGVPSESQRIVSKLLEKDTDLRYQSAAGVISDLKRLTMGAVSAKGMPRKDWWNRFVVVGASLALVVVAGYWIISRFGMEPAEVAEPPRKMLAVLPFENLGAKEDEYFADGITNEIIARLAGFHGLGVISRTSAMQYKNSGKSLREIGKELGVDYVLEGTICWDKSGDTNLVRITPQLVSVVDDTHLWADSYERALTRIFTVQADIVRRIGEALDIALMAEERRALEAEPTDNLEAYTHYLRGNGYISQSYRKEDHLIAIEMLDKAVKLDPNFALAYATLSSAHTWLYQLYERTEERLSSARAAADRALWLDPDLPKAHLALAQYYYQGKREYERALKEVEIVAKNLPNNSEVFLWTAGIKRRQGQWEEAAQSLKRVTVLNPRNSKYFWELGRTYTAMRRYKDAEDSYDRAIAVSPDNALAYGEKSFLHLLWDGNVANAREVLEDAAQRIDPSKLAFEFADCDMFDGDYQSALRRFSAAALGALRHQTNYYLGVGFLYRLMSDTIMSVIYYDSVLAMLEPNIEKAGSASHARLGVAYAGLGRKEEAIREGKLAVELLPLREDAFAGSIRLGFLAMIYILVGEYDLAIDQLEILLSVPSFFSVPYLRVNPMHAPLRDHPRFQALLEKYK